MDLKENLPKSAEVLENYGVDISRSGSRVELKNNWATHKKNLLKARGEDLVRFPDAGQGPIGEHPYPSDPPLTFKTQKWGSSNDLWTRFVLDLETTDQNIAGRFWLSHNQEAPNTWWFDHRDTRPEYTRNHLGDAVSETVDTMMQNLADDKGKEQTITCEVRQIHVLLWFLRNDYTACDDGESQQLIDKILADDGPENFEISSNPSGGMDHYIFPKGEADWTGIEKVHELKDQGKGTTIKLEKKFKPDRIPTHKTIRGKLGAILRSIRPD